MIEHEARAMADCVRTKLYAVLAHDDQIGALDECQPYNLSLGIAGLHFGAAPGRGPPLCGSQRVVQNIMCRRLPSLAEAIGVTRSGVTSKPVMPSILLPGIGSRGIHYVDKYDVGA
jgi:hypothetical protein